jgi:hypothetical protein
MCTIRCDNVVPLCEGAVFYLTIIGCYLALLRRAQVSVRVNELG